jgi:predicted MFS family arabinose efflux permease
MDRHAHPAEASQRPSSFKGSVAAILPITITGTPITVQPGMVQGMVDYMGMNDVRAGFVASAEMAGLMLATILFAFASNHINWRRAYGSGLALVVAANAISAMIGGGPAFTVVRALAGAGAGIVAAIGFASIGETEDAPRSYGWAVAMIIGYSAVVLWALPEIFALGGYSGFLIAYGVATAACLPLVPFLQQRKTADPATEELSLDEVALLPPVGVLAVLSMLVFFVGYAAAWTYMALIGRDLGLSELEVAHALSLSQIAGVAGALAIVVQSGKVHDLVQAGVILVGGAAAIFAFALKQDYGVFLGLNCVFQFCWNAGQPLLLGVIASRDRDGQLLRFTIPMQYIGLAAGPAFAAFLLGAHSNYAAVMIGAGGFAALAPLAIAPLILARKPGRRAPAV